MPVSRTWKCRRTSGSPTSIASRDHDHLALVGELDGVADEVEQDLPQPQRVADQSCAGSSARCGNRARGPSRAPRSASVLVASPMHVAAGRTSASSSSSLPGLDLREVEDVVDDHQQRVGRRLDHLEVVALLARRGRCRSASCGHADDRRSSACGSRGSCWPGTRSWRGWPTRRPPWPVEARLRPCVAASPMRATTRSARARFAATARSCDRRAAWKCRPSRPSLVS